MVGMGVLFLTIDGSILVGSQIGIIISVDGVATGGRAIDAHFGDKFVQRTKSVSP